LKRARDRDVLLNWPLNISDRRLQSFVFMTVLIAGLAGSGCFGSGSVESAQKSATSPLTPPVSPQTSGRYQLVVVPGHPGNPFLIDTHTGCIWHYGQNEKNKRATFVESDVENLHWGWGSGAQQILAAQIDTLTSTEEQKKVLRQNLQKTECGQFNVTLSPDHSRKPESAEPKPSSP
jgi:hypothetical protein